MEPEKTIEERYLAWQSERVVLCEDIAQEFETLIGKMPLKEVAQMLGLTSPKTIAVLKNRNNERAMRSFTIEKRFYYLQKLREELAK